MSEAERFVLQLLRENDILARMAERLQQKNTQLSARIDALGEAIPLPFFGPYPTDGHDRTELPVCAYCRATLGQDRTEPPACAYCSEPLGSGAVVLSASGAQFCSFSCRIQGTKERK